MTMTYYFFDKETGKPKVNGKINLMSIKDVE
ncbi:hypothetical protein JOD45_002057 [Scopulibacillus daqui]|uniref:Uncharacterized protein n=1 Tax=Scopulibacillus daqui TaxID=1469162 RepID=A0ABS2Q0K7_9BACL|nr:hypothetical protein [Scopulibacillus daqui]